MLVHRLEAADHREVVLHAVLHVDGDAVPAALRHGLGGEAIGDRQPSIDAGLAGLQPLLQHVRHRCVSSSFENGGVYTATEECVTLLSLRAGRLAVDLAPDAGGSIARFAVEGAGKDAGDLLRPATDAALASGTGMDTACYPLVPYLQPHRERPSRLRRRSVPAARATGRAFATRCMATAGAHALGGASHQRRGTRAELVYLHERGAAGVDWPFRYRARQIFRLDETGLTVGCRSRTSRTATCRRAWACILSSCAMPIPSSPAASQAYGAPMPRSCRSQRVPVPPEWDFCRLAPGRRDGARSLLRRLGRRGHRSPGRGAAFASSSRRRRHFVIW